MGMIFYRVLSILLMPLLYILIKYRVKSNKEDPKRYKERLGITTIVPDKNKPLIWFHAASIGESISLLSVIKKWIDLKPDHLFLLTTVTKSSAKIMETRCPQGCIHQYIPFDAYPWIKRFINYWNPEQVILVESEIWPNLIDICHKKNIPLTFINATVSDKSFLMWKKISFLSNHVFSKITKVFAQSDEDAIKFSTLGVKKVEVMPHLKYAASPLPFDEKKLADLKRAIKDRLLWLAISTHQGEDEIFFKWHNDLKKIFPNLLTIIIPRHFHRINDIQNLLKDNSAQKLSLYSQEKITDKTDIYIVDTLGDVGLFAALSPIAVLGGTFSNIGGHNPLEPLMLNCATICGPYTQNITTLMDELKSSLRSSKTNEDAFQHLKDLLQDPTLIPPLLKRVHNIIEDKQKKWDKMLVHQIINKK